MLRRLARTCFRRRWRTLIVWIMAVVGLSMVSGAVGDAFAIGFSIDGTESNDARNLLQDVFPDRAGDAGQLVVRAPRGVDDPAVQELTDGTLAEIEDVPTVATTTSPFSEEGARQLSPGGEIAYGEIQFTKRATEVSQETADEIVAIVDDARTGAPAGVQIETGGIMFEQPEFGGTTELIGLLAAIVILLVAFGSLLAMGIPIATALFGIAVSFAFITLLSHVFVMPDFTTQLGAMLGLGVGIDYALFIVTRYRQGLDDGLDPEHATVLALDTSGRAVLFAGATVVVSLFGLFLMGVDFIRGLGVGRGRGRVADNGRVGDARARAARVRRREHRPVPHPGPAPEGEQGARERMVPLEPRRAASPMAGRARRPRCARPDRAAVLLAPARLLRRRQPGRDPDDAARVRPAVRRLRPRFQRSARARGTRPGRPGVAGRARRARWPTCRASPPRARCSPVPTVVLPSSRSSPRARRRATAPRIS